MREFRVKVFMFIEASDDHAAEQAVSDLCSELHYNGSPVTFSIRPGSVKEIPKDGSVPA